MAKRSIAGSRGILTGASSGIGHELATQLFRRGAKLVLVARNEEKLRALAAQLDAESRSHNAASGVGAKPLGQIEIAPGDITDPAVRQRAIETAIDRFGGLDLLINNAGVGALGRFAEASPQRLRSVMEVNFFAAVEMTRAALPALRDGRRPMVVNVSSILGHRGVPFYTDYCASKFAMQGFSEALRAELSPLKIDLLVVSPGTTQTDFFEHALERGEVPWKEQRGVPASLVARRTARAIELGRHEIIVNIRGRVLVLLNRFAPALVDRLLARYG